jgi:NADH-quinone oxidoreductase subunit L
MLLTFFGEKRWQADEQGHEPHPHESPKSMALPMVVLAFGSVFAGGLFTLNSSFLHWLEPVTGYSEGHSPLSTGAVTALTIACMLAGVAVSYLMYGRGEVPVTPPIGSPLTRAARRDLLQDDFNHAVLVRPGSALTAALVYFDIKGLDGFVNGLAATIGGVSSRLRRLQNGYVRSYALSMFGGTLVLVATTLLMRSA